MSNEVFRPMSLLQCERLAQKHGYNSLSFLALFPSGPKKCKWLDADFGFFQVEGIDGFLSTDDIDQQIPDLVVIPQNTQEAA